jgi:uncharacterized protein YjbI with pentapeptide repeats
LTAGYDLLIGGEQGNAGMFARTTEGSVAPKRDRLGPFTGRQLTIIVVAFAVAIVAFPVAAHAVNGVFTSSSNTTPAVSGTNTGTSGVGVQGTGKKYGVSSTGPVGVTVTAGHAPLVVNSATQVANLNASLLGGKSAAAFLPVAGTAANAAKLGGLAPAAYQQRVTGTCAVGLAVTSVAADGTVQCGAALGTQGESGVVRDCPVIVFPLHSVITPYPGMDLAGCDLGGASLANTNLYGADLVAANLGNVNPPDASDLSGANLAGSNGVGANLIETKATNATSFEAANLTAAVAAFAQWPGANLGFVIANGINLNTADLTGANLGGGSFAYANLHSANLPGANLNGGSFAHSDLSGANLLNANLTFANLTDATTDSFTVVGGVTWSNTTCPDGTNSNNDGNTCVGHGF